MKRILYKDHFISLDEYKLIELIQIVKTKNEKLSEKLMQLAAHVRSKILSINKSHQLDSALNKDTLVILVDSTIHQLKNQKIRLMKIAVGHEKPELENFFDYIFHCLRPAIDEYGTKIVGKKDSSATKAISSDDAWKYHKVHFEQLLLEDINKKTNNAFSKALEKIAEKVEIELSDFCPTSVAFCYAWPNKDNQWFEEEQHLQKFLVIFKQHIEATGIPEVILDIRNNENGNNLWKLAKQIARADRVIHVGTKSMRKGIHRTFSPKSREYSLIVERFNKVRSHRNEDPWDESKFISEKNFILPLLYSGSFEKSFPYKDFDYRTTVKPMIGSLDGYYNHLKKWINDIYKFKEAEIKMINVIWSEFEREVEKSIQLTSDQKRQFREGMKESDVNALLSPALAVGTSTSKGLMNQTLTTLSNKLREAPVVILCDPGVDDIVMLGQALSPGKFNHILGIVACAANVQLSDSVRNVLGMLQLANKKIPVYTGSDAPLTPNAHFPTEKAIYGKRGLGPSEKVHLPTSAQTALDHSKIESELIIQIMNSPSPVTIISTAGLTDLCKILMSLRQSNHLHKIGGISMMGGVFDITQANAPKVGEETNYGEFNFCSDPVATDTIFRICKEKDIPIILASLEITHGYARYSKAQTTELKKIGNEISSVIADLLDDVPEPLKKRFGYYNPQQCVYDLFTTMALIDPENFTYECLNVSCRGEKDGQKGRVELDNTDKSPGNVLVLSTVVDQDRFYRNYIESLRSHPVTRIQSPRSSGFFTVRQLENKNLTSIQSDIKKQLAEKLEALLGESKKIVSQLDHMDCGVALNLHTMHQIFSRMVNLCQDNNFVELEGVQRKYRRFIRDLEFVACENDRNRQGILSAFGEKFMVDLDAQLPKLKMHETELVSDYDKVQKLKKVCEYYSEKSEDIKLSTVLSKVAQLSQGKPEVYIIRPMQSSHNVDELWVAPFIDRVVVLLTIAGIKVITKKTHAAAGTSKVKFYNLARESDFVLIFQTPLLKQQHESNEWDIAGAQFIHAINKKNQELSKDLHRVIPIRLCGMEHEQPLFGAGIENRDWPELGFIQGFKIILGDILFQGRPTPEFLQLWTEIEQEADDMNIAHGKTGLK